MTTTIIPQGTVTSPPGARPVYAQTSPSGHLYIGSPQTVAATVLRSAAGTIAARGHWRGDNTGVCVAAAVDESARHLYPTRSVRARIEALIALRNNPQIGHRHNAIAEWEDRASAKEVVALMRATADTLTATDTAGGAV